MNILRKLVELKLHFLLVGPPGCAKTARVREACGDTHRLFYGVGGRTCDLMERPDAAGVLWPDLSAGVARSLPLEPLKEMLDFDGDAVWFLDEIGRAQIDVQGALVSLIDLIRSEKPNFVICAATNRPGDRAGVVPLQEQLRSRFMQKYRICVPQDGKLDQESLGGVPLCSWKEEVDGWIEWAQRSGFEPLVIAWHRWGVSGQCNLQVGPVLYGWKPDPDASVAYPDYRGWATANMLLQHGAATLQTLGACLGRGQAASFLAWTEVRNEIPTWDEIVNNPLRCKLPHDAGALFLVASVAAGQVSGRTIAPYIQFMDRIGGEVQCGRMYAALMGRDAMRRLGKTIANTPQWKDWYTKNQDLFV